MEGTQPLLHLSKHLRSEKCNRTYCTHKAHSFVSQLTTLWMRACICTRVGLLTFVFDAEGVPVCSVLCGIVCPYIHRFQRASHNITHGGAGNERIEKHTDRRHEYLQVKLRSLITA